MCGFLFAARRGRPIDPDRFRDALRRCDHRGPDHQATWHDTVEAGGRDVHVAAGHNRLAIIDLDPRSNQPFRRDGRTLVYNGEIYNFPEVAETVGIDRARLSTASDTEVLLEALAERGTAALSHCNGMWSFALLEPDGSVLMARDRHGKKPLFVLHDDEWFCCASTIGAITALTGRTPRLRPDALDAWLVHGTMFPRADGTTHFEALGQVAPGHAARFDLAAWTLEQAPWFDLAEEAARGAKPDFGDDPADTVRDACRLRLVSDRRVGLLLSGGIDSTLVLSALHAQGLHETVTCFIGETGRSPDAAFARECADAIGIRAEVIQLEYGSETFERFLLMCRHQEKPFPLVGNAMAMCDMYEAIQARDVPVVLDGTGGDEQFGGYWDRQYPFALRDARAQGHWRWLLGEAAAQPGRLFPARKRWIARFKRDVLRRGRATADPAASFCRFDTRAVASPDPLAGHEGTFREALVIDAARGRLGEWIWHNDRNAMMFGIENRSPMLDYRLARWMGTDYRLKFRGGWNKRELRSAFDRLTPLPTQWRRQKQGFRWNNRRFMAANTARILELVRGSRVLADHVDLARFADAARRNERLAQGQFAQRLLGVAGVEEAMGL